MIYGNRGIFFEITNLCNHRCIHCCKYWEDNSIPRTASKKTLDKILAMPKSYLTISGGEPSLVKDKVYYLVEHAKVPVVINTNLTNWSREDIKHLSAKAEFNISVVSLDRQIYRQITKANTFDNMMENLIEVPRDSFITTVINRLNIESMEYTAAVLILMGFKNILITPQKQTPSESVNVDEITNKVKRLHQKYDFCANIMTQGYSNMEYCDHKCDAGIGRFVIDTKNDVYPCAPIHRPCKLGTIDTPLELLEERGKEFYYSYEPNKRDACKGFL